MESLDDLLGRYSTMAAWIDALQTAGAEVTLLQRFHQRTRLQRDGVTVIMEPDLYGPRLRYWQIPYSLHRTAQKVCIRAASNAEPAVIHFNGLIFPLQLRTLRRILPKRFAIIAQHHAEKPSRGLRRNIQRRCLRAADGFFFAASEQAAPWIENGLILDRQKVFQVMEGSTRFRRQDRATARARTRMAGDPVVLWVGRLTALKDPLTVLNGFEPVLRYTPNARLYMVYRSNDLLREVQARIASSALLTNSVTLLGSVVHDEIESF